MMMLTQDVSKVVVRRSAPRTPYLGVPGRLNLQPIGELPDMLQAKTQNAIFSPIHFRPLTMISAMELFRLDWHDWLFFMQALTLCMASLPTSGNQDARMPLYALALRDRFRSFLALTQRFGLD